MMDLRTPESQGGGELDQANNLQFVQTPVVQRACDSCHARKIRCDRNSPCSQCVNSKLTCTHAAKRPKERRGRVHVSSQYEKRIDIIDRRLDEVTRMLREMNASTPNFSVKSTEQKEIVADESMKSSIKPSPTLAGYTTPIVSDSHVIAGESPMDLHSILSDNLLEEFAKRDSSHGDNLALRDTLQSLNQLMSGLKNQPPGVETSYTMANLVQTPNLNGLKLPPIKTTVGAIRRGKNGRETIEEWISFLHTDDFLHTCLAVYFSQDYSLADFIIANFGMYSIFWEMAHSEPNSREENLQYVSMCQGNLETALDSLPLHLPATLSMIKALLVGAFHAVEISKPSLSWVLTSKAAELCLTLGYNRLSTKNVKNDPEHELKLYLFWSVYYMDKSLSLRLGRASNIPDWDLATSMPSKGDFGTIPHSAFICQWIRTARCQGHIYEKLYSAGALIQPDFVRRDYVGSIVKDLEDIRISTLEAHWLERTEGKLGPDIAQFIMVSDDVFRLSLLTLALRASPPLSDSRTTFIPECVEAARATLQRHQDCMDLVQNSHAIFFSSYFNWALLFAPFIPFIVLFCQVIETHDKKDLASLEAFIASTECAPTVSDAAAKMHRLFQGLYRAARQYIEYQASVSPIEQSMDNEELNNYLTTLGLLPLRMEEDQQEQQQGLDLNHTQDSLPHTTDENTFSSGNSGQRGANAMLWMGNTVELEDWLQSNHQMMELMEEPTSNSLL